MSIVKAIHELYEQDERRKKIPTGWPSGSRLGTCAAQNQMLRFSHRYQIAPPSGRTLRTWEQGDRIEKWLAERLEQAYPRLVGLQQEPFYFPVVITPDQRAELIDRIARGQLGWGRVVEQFNPPKLELEGGRVKMRLMPRDEQGRAKAWGFVVDLHTGHLFIPTYVDFVVNHETLGLTIVEAKSMSNFSFRRALMGHLDYGKRCQLVSFARATGASPVLFAYRAETGHMAEIAYLRGEQRTRVLLTQPNGSQEVFYVDEAGKKLIAEGGAQKDIPGDQLWEDAQVWTPYDPNLEAVIDQRILSVLLYDGDEKNLLREDGPDFTCETCQGTGTQTLRKGSSQPLQSPKGCPDCGGDGEGPTAKKPEQKIQPGSGLRDEVELNPYPCGYCPLTPAQCMKAAQPRFEVDDRPHWYVTRANWEASGLKFAKPEGWS